MARGAFGAGATVVNGLLIVPDGAWGLCFRLEDRFAGVAI